MSISLASDLQTQLDPHAVRLQCTLELEKIAAGRVQALWDGVQAAASKAVGSAKRAVTSGPHYSPPAPAVHRLSYSAPSPPPVRPTGGGPTLVPMPTRVPARGRSSAPAGTAPSPAASAPSQGPAAASAPAARAAPSPSAAPQSARGAIQSALAGHLQSTFGVNAQEGLGQFSGGMGDWFSKLSPAQQRNVALGGAGAVAAGTAATGGALGYAAGGNTTIVRT